ncbi:MFS transporter [Candidatus Woesebacteria bacterium]|nr:MFS transporter [Candidatus Woesebacteria bacterium]
MKKWLPLIVLSLGITIIILDTTILNVSLRTIINELNTDIQSIQWVITAYSLVLAAFTITGGRLGDLFGRKKMFMLGAIIFALGSFIASISTNVTTLIAGEAIIEGIGAALMMPATMSLIVSNYKGQDRQIGFGVWGAIAGGAAALGPVVGGWLTTYSSWRWAFRINVGVVALLLIGSLFISEAQDKEEKPTLDIVGVILSALGLLSLVFGFIKASDYGWITMKETVTFLGITFKQGEISLVPIALLLGALILAIFAWWEHIISKKGDTPLVSLDLFKNSQFTLAVGITSILALSQAGLSFSIPVFLQAVKHLNALDTGVAMLPMSLSLLVAAPASAMLSKYISPKRIVQMGLILNALGFLTLRFGIQVTATQWAMAPGFILFGVGMGFMMSQLSNLAISAVSMHEAGEVSGVNGTFRTVGQTLGAAIFGAVLISLLSSNLSAGVMKSTVIPENQKSMISEAVSKQSSSIEFGGESDQSTAQLPAVIGEEITTISQAATVDATHTTLLLGAGFIVLALLLTLPLPNTKNIETGKSIAVGH